MAAQSGGNRDASTPSSRLRRLLSAQHDNVLLWLWGMET